MSEGPVADGISRRRVSQHRPVRSSRLLSRAATCSTASRMVSPSVVAEDLERAGQQVPGAGTLATMSPEWSAPSVMGVRNVPWWGLLSSGAAPVLMVGGWMVATSLQPRSVDPMADGQRARR